MNCIKPTMLTDEQLLAFIDGAATDDVISHVQQCASCRKRANQWARQQKQLLAQLYRVDCPSSLELGEYHIGMVAPERILIIEKHLAHCLHCAREIQTVQNYLRTLTPTAAPTPVPAVAGKSLGQHLHRLVATLVDRLTNTELDNGATPAFANLRGAQEEQFIYNAGDIQIVIEIQADSGQPDRKVLLGLVLGISVGQPVEAYLAQASQVLGIAPIDELGNFVFDHLIPGMYTLSLHSLENEILIEELQI